MSTIKSWASDDELFAIIQRELFTRVVGDVMDKIDLQRKVLEDPEWKRGVFAQSLLVHGPLCRDCRVHLLHPLSLLLSLWGGSKVL